jgi:hypothetical protein
MTVDTTIGMLFSNIITYFIIVATASTLHAHGITQIQTAAQAAEALRPIAGGLAFLLFALGIIGTGLLAIPVFAGSAAYAAAVRMTFHLGGQVSGSDWLLRDHPRRDDHRIRDGILAHQSHSAACLDRCHQRNRRRPHNGGDDADRDQSQGDGSFSGASNARVGGLGCNGFDGRHCRRIIGVATALGSTTSLTASCQSPT